MPMPGREPSNDPLIMVPVPESLVLRVYSLISEASHASHGRQALADSSSNDVLDSEQVSQQLGPDWTKVEDCRRLRHGLPGSPTIKALDYLAEHGGEPVRFGVLAKVCGIDRTNLRGRLAGLTMRIKSLWHISREQVTWPMSVTWEVDPLEAHYEMREEVARSWRQSS